MMSVSNKFSNPNGEEYYNHLLRDGRKGDVVLPPKKILQDFEKFFEYGGGLIHPKKRDRHGMPVRVMKLAGYQVKFARMDRAVMLKNNKAGVTMSESINDFRSRLLPEYAGFDCLLVGQTQEMANEHLLDLKRWVLQSPTLRPFMLTEPSDTGRLREEKSKMKQMYIYNPYDPERRSRIIAIGFSESMAYSWKNINRLHISDPGMISRKNQHSFFSGLYSRLSNTEGQIKIEGVAGDRSGYFFELCKKVFRLDEQGDEDLTNPDRLADLAMEEWQDMAEAFDSIMIDADDSVREGVISTEWLELMKKIMPKDEFLRVYYHKFGRPVGAIFEDLHTGEHEPLGVADLLRIKFNETL